MTMSEASLDRLATCYPELQRLVTEYAKTHEIVVIYGHRGQKEQDRAFELGYSKLKYPHSKHNSYPSRAVDIAPAPIDWTKKAMPRWESQRLAVTELAAQLSIPIRTISWDWPHFELLDSVP